MRQRIQDVLQPATTRAPVRVERVADEWIRRDVVHKRGVALGTPCWRPLLGFEVERVVAAALIPLPHVLSLQA